MGLTNSAYWNAAYRRQLDKMWQMDASAARWPLFMEDTPEVIARLPSLELQRLHDEAVENCDRLTMTQQQVRTTHPMPSACSHTCCAPAVVHRAMVISCALGLHGPDIESGNEPACDFATLVVRLAYPQGDTGHLISRHTWTATQV
jgi:hypothetical protein